MNYKTISAETPEKFDRLITEFVEKLGPDRIPRFNFFNTAFGIMEQTPLPPGIKAPQGAAATNLRVITVYSVTLEYSGLPIEEIETGNDELKTVK